jgi:hypothetical protein
MSYILWNDFIAIVKQVGLNAGFVSLFVLFSKREI